MNLNWHSSSCHHLEGQTETFTNAHLTPSVGRRPPSGTPCPLLPSSGEKRGGRDAEGQRPMDGWTSGTQPHPTSPLRDPGLLPTPPEASRAPPMRRQVVWLAKLVSRPVLAPPPPRGLNVKRGTSDRSSLTSFYKRGNHVLASLAQPMHGRVKGAIPGEGHVPRFQVPQPQFGRVREAAIIVSLASLFLSLSPPPPPFHSI